MLVQLSDLHVEVGPGDDRAAKRVAAAVASIAGLTTRPDAVLVSGDLVHVPSADSYARAKELLAPLAPPLHVLPGNHDDRDLLREHFGEAAGPPAPAGAPVHYAAECGPLKLVAVDTTVPGHVEGHLDRDMLRWLDAQLTAHVARPTILAMHHPPVLSGIRPLDDIGLPGSDRIALARLIARHPHVELITAGHVHRTMVTTFAGRPALICPSTDIQLELDFRPTTTGYHLVHEPPAFAVHVLIDGRIATHVQPVGEFAPMA